MFPSSVCKTSSKFKYKPYIFGNWKLKHLSVIFIEWRRKCPKLSICPFFCNPNPFYSILFLFQQVGTYHKSEYNVPHTEYNDRVNVWVGIIDNTLKGSSFIDGTLNTNKFLGPSQTCIIPEIQNWNIVNVSPGRWIWFYRLATPLVWLVALFFFRVISNLKFIIIMGPMQGISISLETLRTLFIMV